MTMLGILGGGQLGRMLALAAAPLGVRCRVLEPGKDPPAAIAAEVVRAEYSDPAGLDRLADGVDAVTFEFENVPAEAVARLAEHGPVRPGELALATAQDRGAEKALFRRLGIPIPETIEVSTAADVAAALARVGCPVVLKTRRLGYDGKGQHVINRPDEAFTAWEALGGVPAVVEAFVPFDRELSILAVRGHEGATRFYPLVENRHRDGILRLSIAPAPGWTLDLQQQAESIAHRVLDRLDYVGVLAIELFQVGDTLLANEMAPRVHNSGHWTLEGAVTSQFENHVRAVLGWPLGDTIVPRPTAMLNLIGTVPPIESILAVPGAHLHLYGKTARAGRKLGHVTVCADSAQELGHRCRQLQDLLEA